MDVRPIVLVFVALVTAPAFAAPFVAGEPRPFSVRVAASRAAVIIRRVEVPTGGWAVVSVLHDATGTVRSGAVVHPRPAPGSRCAMLISNGDRTVEVVGLSDAAAEYVSSIPAPDEPAADRLRFAAAHFDASDPVVRDDAFAELARLTADDFDRFRRLLPADRLRRVIDSPESAADRVALCGYLLGLCGDESDKARLRRRLFAGDGFATGADGVAAGYLLAAGEEGLADLEITVLSCGETSPLLAAAVLDAFDHLRSHRPGLFSKDRLRRAACRGLARPDAADLVVGYLAAGREWMTLPDVTALLESQDENPDRRRAVQVAAVRFLQECRRDGDAPLAVRSAADRALSQLAANDSDLVRRATVLSGGPGERR